MMAFQQQSLESMSVRDEAMRMRASTHMGTHSRIQDSGIIGKEEIMDLQKKLQSEAENIARWKASTELKAKSMEQDIQTKQSIIEDQRNNLMDLQLHSEHLSQSLFQEQQERELVTAKVTHTRQIFLTLQEQYEQLSQTVSNFENIKDEIQKEHDGLLDKLAGLKQSFELQEDALENMILQAEENTLSFKTAKESWQQNIMGKNEELKQLNDQVETLKSKIENLSEKLEVTSNNLSSVESEKIKLIIKLEEVTASLAQAQGELKLQKEKLTEEITRTNEDLKIEHERFMERSTEFEEAAEKIQYLKKANDILEGTKSELTERVTALATRKQELEEEIAFKENVIHTLQTTQNQSLIEINELNGKINDVCSQLSIAETYKDSLEQERNTLADKLQSSKKKLLKKKQLLEQFKEQVTALQKEVEVQKEALSHLEVENKNKEEINKNLEVSLNEVNKNSIVCNEALKEMTQKISVYENQEVELKEEKKKTEEDLEKTNTNLKIKVQECEELSAAVKDIKDNMEKLEKEFEVKIKNVSSETKSKRLLDQKIKGVEEKLKKATINEENLEKEIEHLKNIVSEKEKECEELKVCLDHALCEKQEFQQRYEVKEESFQSYQNSTNTTLESIKTELDQTKEMLEKTKGEHKQQVLQLQEELSKSKEFLNLSKNNEVQLQEANKAFQEQSNTSIAKFQDELVALKTKMQTMETELEQAKQEASTAIKEKLQIKLESDNKVKEMGNVLNLYKTDKETKLKITEEELQKSQTQITQLMQERDELQAEIKAQTKNSEAEQTPNTDGRPAVKHIVDTMSASICQSPKTPSPNTYLEGMDTFVEPSIPPAPRVVKKLETTKGQIKPVSGILKTGRRTLLPPEFQKRVVFKPLATTQDFASGDSSSDACTFEVADSDDPFEEIKRSRRYPGIRLDKVPRASVPPFMPEANIPKKTSSLPPNEYKFNDEANKGPAINSSKRKRMRSELQKQNLKTYSAVSPKNKQQKVGD